MSGRIVVFEHQTLKLDQEYLGAIFDEDKLKALQKFYGEKGVPYFSLIHKGVRFNEYVGVIQVDNLVIEVLPKADNSTVNEDGKDKWREVLIKMLSAVGMFEIHVPSNSFLKLKANSILDLYFELFINEIEYLLHLGLVKQYRKKEGNVTALKGSLRFSKQIQQNLTHQERFYVDYSTYDVKHKLHFILYKAICLLKQINTNSSLHSRIGALLLHFPEMPDIKVTEETFKKLTFNRKTQTYKKAIDIAKLLLLKYHPDVSNGRSNVLALMFDMNLLWEKFVYITLQKHKIGNTKLTPQTTKCFWQPEGGTRSTIRPDILIKHETLGSIVLDTKWKNLNGKNPSPEDLRQMYVYHKYYNANQVALVYPGNKSVKSGYYLEPDTGTKTNNKCGVISFAPSIDIKQWQKDISDDIHQWMNSLIPV